MIVTDENKKYYLQAMKVGFLTEQWEREQYAAAIKSATEWGRKMDRINKENRSKNRLTDKYNV